MAVSPWGTTDPSAILNQIDLRPYRNSINETPTAQPVDQVPTIRSKKVKFTMSPSRPTSSSIRVTTPTSWHCFFIFFIFLLIPDIQQSIKPQRPVSLFYTLYIAFVNLLTFFFSKQRWIIGGVRYHPECVCGNKRRTIGAWSDKTPSTLREGGPPLSIFTTLKNRYKKSEGGVVVVVVVVVLYRSCTSGWNILRPFFGHYFLQGFLFFLWIYVFTNWNLFISIFTDCAVDDLSESETHPRSFIIPQ